MSEVPELYDGEVDLSGYALYYLVYDRDAEPFSEVRHGSFSEAEASARALLASGSHRDSVAFALMVDEETGDSEDDTIAAEFNFNDDGTISCFALDG